MLTITVPPVAELWDEATERFIQEPGVTMTLEHSLFSLSKWEQKWETPFLAKEEKTPEQTYDYVRCMTLTEGIDPEVYQRIPQDIIEQIGNYVNAKMTATWFNEQPAPKGRAEVITAEIIYHWMVALTIPFECQYWHLNRLITLVKVCNEKNKPADKKQKLNPQTLAARNRELNERRKQQLKTSG